MCAHLTSVGLGLDVGGAIILAFGLLASPKVLGAMATPFWDFSPYLAAAGTAARVDAEFGITGLVLGIALQAAGVASGESPDLGAALVAAAVAGLVWCGVWLALRRRRQRALIVQVARARMADDQSGFELRPLPDATRLMAIGRAAGYEWDSPVESVGHYAKRVFGLSWDKVDDPQKG